jgi:hypothetical protein
MSRAQYAESIFYPQIETQLSYWTLQLLECHWHSVIGCVRVPRSPRQSPLGGFPSWLDLDGLILQADRADHRLRHQSLHEPIALVGGHNRTGV